MTYRSSSRRGSGEKFQKSSHEKKAKAKAQKQTSSGIKYAPEEQTQTPKDIVDKTLVSLSRLGTQIFALSPFSQYYDDWLVNLRQVISEFENNSAVKVDEVFTKEREQIFLDIEGALAEKRLAESDMTGVAKDLADTNHQLADADKEYAEKIRELSNKRNADVQRLSSKIRELEDSVEKQKEIKISVFKPLARRAAQQKLESTIKELNSTKNELEVTLQNFTAEQEKAHDNYEKLKDELTAKSDTLHKELEKLEVDTSMAARQAACNSLANAINGLAQRMPAPFS
jgi:chromosome segregation ATPase